MIDTLIGKLKIAMDGVKDHRKAAGNLQHSLGDILMAAFAMFHLKDPSLLIFRQRLEERWANLQRVYGIQSVPGDTAMRQALDGVEPATVGKLFKSVLQVHGELGLWEGRKVLGNYLPISMDGTQHYCSSKKSCEHCLVKQKPLDWQNFKIFTYYNYYHVYFSFLLLFSFVSLTQKLWKKGTRGAT